MPLSQQPITISGFLGLYNRGDSTMIPRGHQRDLENMLFINDRLVKRSGFRTLTEFSREYTRFFDYHAKSGLKRIYFDGSTFYADDAQVGVGFSSATDFTMINMNNRAYIAPNRGAVQVYDGATMRAIAGEGPPEDNLGYSSSSPFYPTLASAGDPNLDPFQPFNFLDIGRYVMSISYEIGTYITKPGYIRAFDVDSLDTNRLRITNLPTSFPAKVSGISLSLTRLFVADGDVTDDARKYYNYTFYFVPFGRFAISGQRVVSRTGTPLTELNFPHARTATEQTQLVNSKYIFFNEHLVFDSTYLQDQEEELTDVNGITQYNDRLIAWKDDRLYASRVNDPESIINSLRIGIEESGPIKTCFTQRDILYICKEHSTYSVVDNGETVDTWNPVIVDRGLGSSTHGVGVVRGFEGSTENYVFVANRQGLCLFDGVFAPIEASWKIKELWDTITDLDKTQILVDTRNKLVHVLVLTDRYEIWTMNYQKGMVHQEVRPGIVSGGPRWSRLTLGAGEFRSISLDDQNRLVVLATITGKTALRYIVTDRVVDDDFLDPNETIAEHFTNNDAAHIQDFIDRGWRLIDPISERNIAARVEFANLRPREDLMIYRYPMAYVRCKGSGHIRIFDTENENSVQHAIRSSYHTVKQRLLSRGEELSMCVCHQGQGAFELSQVIAWASRLASQ